jgi:photosystem II stability/assembly factor-like uncharacterized protein
MGNSRMLSVLVSLLPLPSLQLSRLGLALAALLCSAAPVFAQQSSSALDPALNSGMKWRLIGPHRGGRVSAVAGIPGDPATFYMGTPGGGVWKTTDAGQVWKPISDSVPVASIGAIAVAPSNPNIIYVGTGEQTPGNGVYKSTDAGATWSHIGLDDTRYISSIFVDPRNPEIVVVGVLGHPILSVSAPSPARGVFKSTDGGKSWKKTLYKDDMAGVADLCADPANPHALYAALWHPADWAAGEEPSKSRDAWLYKSLDEGSTWTPLPTKGLPDGPWGRTGIAVGGKLGRRIFAIIEPGLFRSDDAGATWRQITKDPRVVGSFYFSRVFVDPRDADTVYVMQTSAYRSTDGGQTFISFKGAPGGDDYHVMWIDPQNSSHLFFGVDQGAIISLDAGKTWSSWFNQPTGQFYDVVTDTHFPYFAYASQQDSGTAAVPSRSDYGEITFRDWFSFGGFEFCSIAPDPLNPNLIYSGGWFGSVVRFDKTTGQTTHVFVPAKKYHHATMPPLVFSPQDPHTLYYAAQFVLKTTDAGQSWQEISPDLTARPAKSEPPAHAAVATAAPARFLTIDFRQGSTRAVLQSGLASGHDFSRAESGAPSTRLQPLRYADENSGGDDDEEKEQFGRRPPSITALAPSPVRAGVLWAGASNGLVQLTQDNAATWTNVSPPNFTPESRVISIEPSHFNAAAAYITLEIHKDRTPYIYRTRDAGKSWQKITSGLAADWVARAVREDPSRKDLLYAATENSVYVSFDDGDHWQSLQLNLPTSDVRDLAVHGDDLVAATYGRALWILDDLSPLRQASAQIAASPAYFFRPADAVRIRWDNDQETPLPPEVPAGKNPPDGAIFYYFLKSVPQDELTIEIRDMDKNLVRRITSVAPPADTTLKNAPDYWFAPPAVLTKNAGLNRFAWNLRYDPPPTLPYSYWGTSLDYIEYTLTVNSIPGETPVKQILGPLVIPGKYEVTFIGGGVLMRQPLVVLPDPRIHATQQELTVQFIAGAKISSGLKTSAAAYHAVAPVRAIIAERLKNLESLVKQNAAAKEAADALNLFQVQLEGVLDGSQAVPGFGAVNRDLARLSFMAGSGDAAPSNSIEASIDESCTALSGALLKWRDLSSQSLPPLNSVLAKFSLAPLPAPSVPSNITSPCSP